MGENEPSLLGPLVVVDSYTRDVTEVTERRTDTSVGTNDEGRRGHDTVRKRGRGHRRGESVR